MSSRDNTTSANNAGNNAPSNNNNTNTNIGSGNMNHIGTKRRRQTRAFDLASANGGNHQVSRRQSMW